MALHISGRLFPERVHYGPIAALGIEKYRFLERFGLFGIDPQTRAGAERFLQVGSAVLSRSDGAFWVTPQGHFADVRERPIKLQSGVGHLARKSTNFLMLPVALEYTFWNERYPEAFAAIGEPILVENGRAHVSDDWTAIFSAALQRTQERLSQIVVRRDPDLFQPLLAGSAGVGGVYDCWRGLKARVRGKRFAAEHGRI